MSKQKIYFFIYEYVHNVVAGREKKESANNKNIIKFQYHENELGARDALTVKGTTNWFLFR